MSARQINIIRWTARVIGLLVLISLLAFTLIAGLPRLIAMDLAAFIHFLSFLVMVSGLFLAWKWEGLGSLVILGGFGAFFVLNWILWGSPALGWVFTLFPMVGLLHLYCWRQDRPAGSG